MIEGIPTYAKIDVPRQLIEDEEGNLFKMAFPITLNLTTSQVEPTDIELYFSMDCKDPCEINHSKKITKKEFSKLYGLKV